MTTLTENEVLKWCEKRDRPVRPNKSGLLSFGDAKQSTLAMQVPEEAELRIALSGALLSIADFYGGVLWLKGWDLGDVEALRAGWSVVESMRSGLGQIAPIETAPGHLFRLDEIHKAHAFLSVVLLWSWQAFWVPAALGYFVYLHHNDRVEINVATPELAADIRTHMVNWQVTSSDAA